MKTDTKTTLKRVAIVIGLCYLAFVAFNCWRLFVLGNRSWQPFAAFSSPPVFKRGMPKQQLEKLWWEAHERDRWFEYKMPISFYGRVVDENGVPVASAQIRFEWSDTSKHSVSRRETTSDVHGLFSLAGVRGKNLGVWLSKEGYYTAWQTNPHRFEYAQYFDPDFHEPDPKKPVVFMLRKKGVAEPLIHRKLKVNLASDGTPARVGLLRGDESGDAQIELQMWKSSERDEHGRFDWRVVIRTVAGGVLETKEEFPFTAPYGGYQKEVEIKNSVDLGKEWNAGAKVQCFLKFGEPPRYALMKAHILGTSRWAFVECWVNPSGSRNLEYDYQKDVTQQFNK